MQEAKEITVAMAEAQSLTPPPRRIADILAILDEQEKPQTKHKETFEGRADAPPPESARPAERVDFYFKRGFAAWQLGRQDQALADLRRALNVADKAGIQDEKIFHQLAKVEKAFGHYRRALALLERARATSRSLAMYDLLVTVYAEMGDLENAKKAYDDGIARFVGRAKTIPKAIFHVSDMEAVILGIQGRWKEAEPHIRKSLQIASTNEVFRVQQINHRLWLAGNLGRQGRLLEAEVEARQALKDALTHLGRRSSTTWKALDQLVQVVLSQGRLQDSERLAAAQIRLLEDAGVPSDSNFISKARMSMGHVLATKGDFVRAMDQFDMALRSFRKNQFDYRRFSDKIINLTLCLVMVGRTDEALGRIANTQERFRTQFGEKHYMTAEVLALQGLAESRTDKHHEALKTFGKSIPILIEGTLGEIKNFPRLQRLKVILETYLGLLSRVQGTDLERELGRDSSAEAFRIADALRSRSVQGALAASSARAAVMDPTLSGLIRKEQDAQGQIEALQEILVDLLAVPADEQVPKLLEEVRGKLAVLARSRAALLHVIKGSFPKYSGFVNPEPGTVEQTQRLLRAGEVLLSIYTSEDHSYLWAIPREGKVRFSAAPLGKGTLSETVAALRRALDPKPDTLGDIPSFDLAAAHGLYQRLLQPVEQGWRDAKDLIVVAGGPLGQLPLSVLPTASVSLDMDRGELFSSYRNVPWLIRKFTITRLPSVSSFITLRDLPEGDPKRKAFAGFGDPIFSRVQFTEALAREDPSHVQLASRGGHIHVRGIRQVEGGDLDRKQPVSSQLANLNRLPDTAHEIRAICDAVGGDLTRDIFLGKDASKHRLKSMDFSDRRVIAFATHALLPGDLDGLDQPALALSAPDVTGFDQDGLLTLEEILKLKLNADWVVLSACNTGAAQGEGAEAASGLGRAFFYAGTRAVLVSMWPVETTSAMKLTTGLFRYQREDRSLNRARALRKSILQLIDREDLKDSETGKIAASYAHPFFWAPFIVVGETGL
ncbi:MAG: CHAT domain-containing tetratricopeptide repeat protein [Thermodesulfobacteriota bacterium]